MANLMFDGAEGVVGITAKGWTSNNIFTQNSGAARTGSLGYLHSNGNTTNPAALFLLPSTVAHGFFGVGHRTSVYPTSANCNYTTWDGATAQVGWRLNSDGSIGVYRGSTNAATLIGTTTAGGFVLGSTQADFHMIELEVVYSTTTSGSISLRIGGTTILTVSGIQTSNSANNYANSFSINGSGSYNVSNCAYDDFYVNDDTGSGPDNTFYGEEFACVTLSPTSDGTYDGSWTPNSGTDASNRVQTSDGDTSYISSGTVNQKQSYNMSNVGLSGTVIGIGKQLVVRKDNVAPRTAADLLLISGTDYLGTTRTMTGSYINYYERLLLNPATSAKFTTAELDALELGVKVIS